MKKMIIIAAVVCALLFCGCNTEGSVTAQSTESGNTSSVAEHKNKTVALEYNIKTDIPYPIDLSYIRMTNGYAVFYQPLEYTDGWNAIDMQGKLVFDEPYLQLTAFDSNGWAAAQKHTGEYVAVNVNGEETPITEAEFEEIRDWTSDKYKEEFSEQKDTDEIKDVEDTTAVGFYYNGLAPYAQKSENGDYLLGVVDSEGRVVVDAFISIDFIWYTQQLSMYEDTIIINDNGYIGIVNVVRS